MRLILQTKVPGTPPQIIAHFERELFERLNPPGLKVELVRFDGSQRGDRVHLRLFFPLIRPQDWVSEITEDVLGEKEAYFVDEGRQLPFFLSYWRHKHLIRAAGEGESLIIDDIQFRSPYRWMDVLLYPVLWLQFAYRKPVYRKYFKKIFRQEG